MDFDARPYLIPKGKGRFLVKIEIKGGTRTIGTIDNGCYYKTISFEKHMLHKKRSVGFNRYLIEHIPILKEVAVTIDGEVFRATKEKIIKEGVAGVFEGFEPQLFLDIDKFNQPT